MPTLAATQQLLRRLITAPEGVAATLAADADRGGDLRDALAATIRGDGGLDAVQRLDIYANMYFFRLLDVVQEHYPATRALFGDVGFHNLITDYLLHHPPAHFSVRHVGDHLPDFVATHAAGLGRPYLAELAQLEQGINDAFDAEDQPALSPADLADVPVAGWAGMRLHLHPSVRLLRGDWGVHTVRGQVDRGEPAAVPLPEPTALCVWRQDLVVVHRAIDIAEYEALLLVQQGATFGAICSAAAADQGELQGAQRMAAVLAGWVGRGCLSARIDWN